jgi:CheY-like chemotaxis protein
MALVDLHMPGRDGWSLALALAAEAPATSRIPLVLMSDPWNLHLARTRAMPGIAGCLPKPIDYRKLAALVARFAPAPPPAFAAARAR